MKWFVLERRFYGESDHESMLYRFLGSPRQLCLPTIKGRPYNVSIQMREPLPAGVEDMETWGAAVTEEAFQAIIQRLCAAIPEKSELIRSLQPCAHVGHRLLTRTGPACPEIVEGPYGEDYIVRRSLKDRLTGVPGIAFFPAVLKKIVPLNWELGQPVPPEFVYYEPESYILDGTHSPEVAKQMGEFYELILPEAHWYPLKQAPRDPSVLRIRFKGDLPSKPGGKVYIRHGRVQLAFVPSPQQPWVRLVCGSPDLVGVYTLAREDVVEIIRDAAKWTLAIQEVEQL